MEIVVFHSDIARLVLAYLKNQRLEKASRIFCKTSPHLQQEYTAFKQGLQAYSFFPELEEIIREYVKITRKVEQVVAALPEMLRPKFQHKKLSQKLNEFLDRSLPVIVSQCGGDGDTKDDCKTTNNSTASCNTVQSDKENKAKKLSDRKRKRATDSTNTSNERSTKNETPKKRRRVLEPFCFLTVTRKKVRRNRPHSSASSIDQIPSTENDEKNHDETSDSEGEIEDETDVSTDEEDIDNAEDNEDVCILDKPTKESTPRAKTAAPTLSEFSQAILDNPQFQQKLVENINQALQTSGCLTADPLKESLNEVNASARKTRSSTSQASKLEVIESEVSLATSSQMLDQLVKDILANTEKDPTFDDIIQDVVGASTTKSLVFERSHVDGTTLPVVESINGADNISTISTVPPSTPLLIRSIPSNVISNNSNPQTLPSQTGNNSFGSLIDPNFSISKLIVLNSNDSAQKHTSDPTLGNTTADNLLNQLSSQSTTSVGGNELSSVDDQVYFDVNTGQLTLPLFLTNDGFLTNFPFLINNELITQQLQPDNIANLDSTRIEIPLPEPISFSADQLPPNSIIVGSTQKNEATEGIQRTVCKLQKNISVVPASLDSRMNVERATPSTNGIVNAKAFKSLSTPRKRASHVRTLTFSPRSHFVPSTTPLSTRIESVSRFQRAQTTMPMNLGQTMSSNVEKTMHEEPEKSTAPNPEVEKIKNAALQNSTKVASVAATLIDTSANESSNSCSVPPFFAMEESSNQTVIKANLPNDSEKRMKKPEPKVKMVAETPKRKQLRKTAVRACKRVLSKSATEEEEEVIALAKQNEENSKNEESDLNSSKLSDKKTENESDLAETIKQKKDRMMEEWVRMRTATNNDLDSRLREWNSKMMYTRPNQKCVKKLRKKRVKSLAATAAKRRANQSLIGDQNVSIEKDKASGTEAITTKQTDTSGSGNNGSGNESQAKEKQKTKLKKAGKTKGKAKDPNSSAEFNIKITTPQKATNSTVFAKKDVTTKVKLEKVKQEETKENSIEVVDNIDQANILNSSTETSGSIRNHDNVAKLSAQPPSSQIHSESIEREKRTANIACLLETPFKDAISSNSLTATCVPPTPGVFGTSFETPLSKLKPTTDDLHSHSFLFGSLTKSESETPLLSAITPGGFKFTPFGSKDATPRSVTATEYSSGGGSYYRPDESDDLDRNIDKLLRDSTQKKTVITPEKVEVEQSPTFEITSGTQVEKSKSFEIPAEKLKVEPIVLKRVKSFGSEAVDSAVDALANIDPHYTLAAGLPDVSDEDEASSSSSSSETSSSSSCNSSSSGTSSASSRTSSKSNNGKNSETVIERHDERQSLNVSLALDNLSEISSTEDDEWQKLAASDGENSQLFDHDGEVRYPVRSWLTPSKATNTTTAVMTSTTTRTAAELPISNPIKVKLPLKVSQKRNKQLNELEEKRQRMKSKLKNDSEHKKRVLQSSSTAQGQAATRRLQLAKEVKLKKMQQKQNLQKVQENRFPDEDVTPCTIDVLTALNLSAKKQPSVAAKEALLLEVIPKLEPLGDVDDNAISNVFESASALAKQTSKHVENKTFETTKTVSLKLKSPVKPKQITQKQRKCLQIEARPVGPSRGAKSKSLKKAPARSKVAASSMTSETAEAENMPDPTPKPSPIPKIKIKSSAGVNLYKPQNKTNYGAKSSNNNKDEHVSSEKTSKPLISRKLKTPVKKPGAKLLQKQAASSHKPQQVKQQKSTEPQRKDTVDEQVKTTTEQKVVKQRINETATKESPTVMLEKSPVIESVAVPKPEPSIRAPAPASVPQSCTTQPVNEEDEDISEDDDPLKYCTLTSYTEDDGKGHFITLKYKGIDGEAPKQSNTVYDLSNFRMVIAFDEDEQHTLQVSEEYCLFECKPNQQQQKAIKSQPAVRNIPKKRKLRVATTSTSDDSIESTSLTTNAIKSLSNSSPTASSTPLSAMTLTQKENNDKQTSSAKATKVVAASKEDKIKPLPVKSTTTNQAQEKPSLAQEKLMTPLAPSLNSAAAEKIHIEDIESILSHLHGT